MTPKLPNSHARLRILAYAAAAWAFAFAAVNFYWGVGGTVGVSTLGERMAELALSGDPELLFVNWLSVVGKIMIGILALLLVRQWQSQRVRRWLSYAIWLVGILLTFYGVGNLIQHILMLVGNIPIASMLGSDAAVRWHMLLWDPIWIVGGVLFLLAARHFTVSEGTISLSS